MEEFNNEPTSQNIVKKIGESELIWGLRFVGIGVVIIGCILSITIVGAGKVGVVSLFGSVRDTELQSGFHLVNPLVHVEKMDIKTQQYTMSISELEGEKKGDDSIDVLTKEGLTLKLDTTAYYHLTGSEASTVYKEIGVDYVDKIVRPEVRNAIREVGAKYSANELYSAKREEYVTELSKILEPKFKVRGLTFERVIVRNIKLPTELNKAIESKQSAEQEAQKMEFVLEREKLEADRKVQEARGIRDSQDIIAQKLSPEYLQWYSIDMMKSLAGSQNTTFLFVPTGQNGMPIVNITGR